MSKPIRIGIADAHYVVREGFKAVLSREPDFEIVGECVSGDCIASLLKKGIDVLLFDFDSEGSITMEDIEKVHRIDSAVQIILVSSHQEAALVNRAMRQGLSGYLFKECDESEIISAVKFAQRGERFFCNRVLDILLDTKRKQSEADCKPSLLSKRELEIVEQISQGLTASEIADKLYLSAHTVSTHRKNIFRKLGVNSTAELVRHALTSSMI